MTFDLLVRTRELFAEPFALAADPADHYHGIADSIMAGHYDSVVEFGVIRTALAGEVVTPGRRLERARELLLGGYVNAAPFGSGSGAERARSIRAGKWDRTAVITATMLALSPEARKQSRESSCALAPVEQAA